MVAQQGETVQRIDADVHDISTFVFLFRALLPLLCNGTLMKDFLPDRLWTRRNVQGAKSELLKYYASVSSNRWLMLKIFGVMIIFVSPSNRLQVAAVEKPSQTDAPSCRVLAFRLLFPVDSSCSLSSSPNVVYAPFSWLSDQPSLGFIHVALTDFLPSLHSLKKE